jgi:threonine dehydrogenase-like Zn-dependent dehydrogenase
MGASSLAAVAVGGRRFRLDEFPVPDVEAAGGLLRVEACGVCGSDLKKYSVPSMRPTILGHETVGRIERVGALAARHWGVSEGDRVLLEEYLPCGHCDYCRSGEFRSCAQTDNQRAGSIRYGSTPVEVPPALWGGYSHYQFLHLDSVLHPVPGLLAPEHATFALPLGNGFQWAQLDGGVGTGDTVVIQGPGQQGLGCLLASKAAGAGCVIVSGLERDARRLRLAAALGADHTVNVEAQSLTEVVEEVTQGRLADVVIDNSGGGAATLMTALRVVRKRGTVVLASGSGSGAEGPAVDLNLIRKRQVTVKGVRGHGYGAVETALAYLASGNVPLELVCGPPLGLGDVGLALETTGGLVEADAPHVSVSPWH